MNYQEYFGCPRFLQLVYVPKVTSGGCPTKDTNGDTISESKIKMSKGTHQNVENLNQKGLDLNSHPAEWFNTFMLKYSK